MIEVFWKRLTITLTNIKYNIDSQGTFCVCIYIYICEIVPVPTPSLASCGVRSSPGRSCASGRSCGRTSARCGRWMRPCGHVAGDPGRAGRAGRGLGRRWLGVVAETRTLVNHVVCFWENYPLNYGRSIQVSELV